ncbi:uncharacterized protein LOC135946487 [Cloeon dipterum]|uniref:uncharacterized protein LOC135946487 n=1 Tax=Cloeon dipterum TaxID=197152 RepID=UPI00321F6D6F
MSKKLLQLAALLLFCIIEQTCGTATLGTPEPADLNTYNYVAKLVKDSFIEQSSPIFVISKKYALSGTFIMEYTDTIDDYIITSGNPSVPFTYTIAQINYLDFGLVTIKICGKFTQDPMQLTPVLSYNFTTSTTANLIYFEEDTLMELTAPVPSGCECEQDAVLQAAHDMDAAHEACIMKDSTPGACSLILDAAPTYVRGNAMVIGGVGVAFLDHDHCNNATSNFNAGSTYVKIQPYYNDILKSAIVDLP